MSRNKLRNLVLTHRLSSYQDHHLTVRCDACDRDDEVALRQFPPTVTINDVLRRLRCRACRKPPSVVILADANLWHQVRLEGPGSVA